MAEQGQSDMPPKDSQPKGPEQQGIPTAKGEKAASPEEQARVRGLWDEAKKRQVLPVETNTDIEELIRRGMPPVSGGAEDSTEPGQAEERSARRGIEFDITGINDPLILQQLNRIKTVTEAGISSEGVLQQALEDIIKLPSSVPDAELKLAIGQIQEARQPFIRQREENARREGLEDPRGFWMKLKADDFIMLKNGKIAEWVNKQYDIVYTATQGTRVAESQLLNDAQAAYGEANLYLSKILNRPEKIAELRSFFETRLNLILMSSTISTKNIEQVQQRAGQLLATGLLHGTSLDNGRVGSMFNRACELLEDMRLKGDRGHLTPIMWEELRRNLIDQELGLAKKGVGIFIDGINVEEREAAITRSVNTALDIVVSSQRLHIIAARGKELFGTKSFFSDAGSAFRVFNLETFHSYKWQLYNTHEVEMNNLVKESLIEEWLEGKEGSLEHVKNLTPEQIEEAKRRLELRGKYKEQLGDSLLKEMSTVNDFFSNGWRIDGMLDQLDLYFAHKEAVKEGKIVDGQGWKELPQGEKNRFLDRGKEKANDFGLFFRLRGPREGGKDNRAKVWGKIVKYRPEEVVRLLRDRMSEFDPELKATYAAIFQGTEIKNYDEFKEKFGGAIRALREEGMRADNPYQVDFTNLTEEQKQKLNVATESKAEIVIKIYKQMQEHIGNRYIKNNYIVFEWDPRFADIYNRTLNADDGLVGRLEDVQKEFGDMTAISKIWSADIGGDVLVRNMNDIAAGQQAVEHYMKFISAESEKQKLEEAEKCAEAYANPNGAPARAKVLRHTYISFLKGSMLPEALQALGIKHLPFRMSATKMQKIYGPQMEGFSVDELLTRRDHIKSKFIANADQARKEAEATMERIENDTSLDETEKQKKIHQQHEKIEHAEKDAHKQASALDRILRVTPKDRIRLKAYSLLAMLLAFVLGEALEVTGFKELAKQK